ncbi:MAG: outer membrane protein assembly factor BamA [Alphaproteobacteria bacterium]
MFKNKLITTTVTAAFIGLTPMAHAAVNSVQVNGNQLVDTGVITSYINTAGSVDKSVKALYDTGLFKDVSIRQRGSTLIVNVVENPVVNRVAFEGNRKLKDKQLSSFLKTQPRSVLSESKVQQDVRNIITAYESAGYTSVSVSPKQIKRSNGRVDVIFEINEKRGFGKEGISRITFNGNRAFSDTALRNEIQSRQGRWYNFMSSNDIYDPDRMNFDKELLRRFYLKRGYADVDVRSATAEKSSRNGQYHISYTLREGTRYRVGNITYRIGLSNLSSNDLKGALKFRSGSWFNIESVEKTTEALRKRLNSLGYTFAQINPRLTRDRKNNVVDIDFELTQGRRNYVERIDVVGNTRTRDHVIRRQIKLSEGDAFNADALKISERRIKGLNFFDRVNIGVNQGSTPDQSVIRVAVNEKSTATLNFGAGYSSSDGVAGNITYTERNLFGLGQTLRADLSIGGEYQSATLSFTEPYFLNKPISAGFDIFYNQRDYQDESSYDRLDYGASLRLGYRLNEYLTQSWKYTLQYSEIENIPSDASHYIKQEEGDRIKSALAHTLTFDTRDSRYDTRRGILLTMTNELAGLGGDVKYIKNTGQASIWQPVYRNIIFSAHLRGGHIKSWGGKDEYSDRVHLFDRFHLGQPLVRGFDNAGIDPRDAKTGDALGGNWYAAATAQIDFPLPTPKDLGISGHVFMDAGRIGENDFQPATDINYSDAWRYSVGAGLRWDSPMGPLTLDYAIPLNSEKYDNERRFYFYVGTQF